MKKAISIIGLLIIVILPLIGCSESGDTANPTNSIANRVGAIEAKVPVWDSYGSRLQAVEQRPASSFDASGLNSKDTDLQNQINALNEKYEKLKTDQSWIEVKTSSSSSSSSSSSISGDDEDAILSRDGDLILQLARSVDDEFYLRSGSDSERIRVNVINEDDESHDFTIWANFTCEDTVSVTNETILDAIYSESSSYVMEPAGTLDAGGTSTRIVTFISKSSEGSDNNEWWIGKDREEMLDLVFTPVYYDDNDRYKWKWKLIIEQTD